MKAVFVLVVYLAHWSSPVRAQNNDGSDGEPATFSDCDVKPLVDGGSTDALKLCLQRNVDLLLPMFRLHPNLTRELAAFTEHINRHLENTTSIASPSNQTLGMTQLHVDQLQPLQFHVETVQASSAEPQTSDGAQSQKRRIEIWFSGDVRVQDELMVLDALKVRRLRWIVDNFGMKKSAVSEVASISTSTVESTVDQELDEKLVLFSNTILGILVKAERLQKS